jgi:hypothetical protein
MPDTLSNPLLNAFKEYCDLSSAAASNARRLPILNASNEIIGSDSIPNVGKAIMASSPSVDQSFFNGAIAKALFDNIFIAVTRVSDGYSFAVRLSDWATYNNSEYAKDGVLVVEGDEQLVVACDEMSLPWGNTSDSHTATGNPVISDRKLVIPNTLDGKTLTAQAYTKAEYQPTSTAIGYVSNYSTINGYTTGQSYASRGAGNWFLPSIKQLMMIRANACKINLAMALIGGTELTLSAAYWSSTEHSTASAWYLTFYYGTVTTYNKKYSYRVRPVSAF